MNELDFSILREILENLLCIRFYVSLPGEMKNKTNSQNNMVGVTIEVYVRL